MPCSLKRLLSVTTLTATSRLSPNTWFLTCLSTAKRTAGGPMTGTLSANWPNLNCWQWTVVAERGCGCVCRWRAGGILLRRLRSRFRWVASWAALQAATLAGARAAAEVAASKKGPATHQEALHPGADGLGCAALQLLVQVYLTGVGGQAERKLAHRTSTGSHGTSGAPVQRASSPFGLAPRGPARHGGSPPSSRAACRFPRLCS